MRAELLGLENGREALGLGQSRRAEEPPALPGHLGDTGWPWGVLRSCLASTPEGPSPAPGSGRQVCYPKGCPLATVGGLSRLEGASGWGSETWGLPLSGSDHWARGQSAPCPGLRFPSWETRGTSASPGSVPP